MGRLPTCAAHGLAFDPSVSSGCVLCRQGARAEQPPSKPRQRPSPLTSLAILVALTGGGALLMHTAQTQHTGLSFPVSGPSVAPTPTSATVETAPRMSGDLLPSLDDQLSTKNESGRSGSFFLPERSLRTPIPLLVAFHRQGGEGASILGTFRALAVRRHFAILAPSSNYVAEASSFTWRVGDKLNDISSDFPHVKACLDELAARTDVALDRNRVLAVGFSGGASSAPYVATNTEPYGAFAVLHGGVFIGGIGPRKVRGWFSTGDGDTARTPSHVNGHFLSMRGAGFDVVMHVYPGGHWISPQEAEDVVTWWLNG